MPDFAVPDSKDGNSRHGFVHCLSVSHPGTGASGGFFGQLFSVGSIKPRYRGTRARHYSPLF